MNTYSPLLEREAECRLVRTISPDDVRRAYQRDFGYDTVNELAGVDAIRLLECQETGLLFFTPASSAGHEGLYRRLETFDWNYKEKKWEHDAAISFVQAGTRVLDVGCGRAAFLSRAMSERGATATGLEFNGSAAEFGRSRGVEVFTQSIEGHADQRPGHYDVVTSFQVLEHVTEPAPFLRACVKALRPGGRLLLGVPNNDSFLGLLEDNWLNMPPHHMSLWSRSCLEGLVRLFDLEHLSTLEEPLQERAWYQAVFERRHLKGRMRRYLYYKLGFDDVFERYIDESWATIPGHTILAAYLKPQV